MEQYNRNILEQNSEKEHEPETVDDFLELVDRVESKREALKFAKQALKLEHDTPLAFSRNRYVKFTKIYKQLSEESVLKASRQFPGERNSYHIIRNNCYTFVM